MLMIKAGRARLHLWLSSIRDGFITLLPLTFFRALAELIHSFPSETYHYWMEGFFGSDWQIYFERIIQSTNYAFGLALAVLVAVHLMRHLPNDKDSEEILPVIVGVSALINFMLVVFTMDISDESLGFKAIFLGSIVGIVTTELLRKIAYLRIFNMLRVPYEAEVNFFYATWLAPSVIFIGVVFLISDQLTVNLPTVSQNLLIPLTLWIQNQPYAIWLFNVLATLINQLFWSIGFHGGLILDAYASDLFLATGFPSDGVHVMRSVFDNYILLGGSGATMGLLIAILLVAKEGTQRKIGQLSILPSIFNINDPLLYGLPIVLNPRYLLPFIGVPILLTLIVVSAIQLGIIIPISQNLPWTTPVLISGWLLTESWHGVALQILEIAISAAIYIPFVKKVERYRLFEEQSIFNEASRAIVSDRTTRLVSYERKDHVGMIARGLLADLRKDLNQENFYLMFQPKHNKNGQVIGVEALARWTHKKHGAISPEVAITLAEESGDINQLGVKVIEQACDCKKRWNDAGYRSLTMAINISPLQLMNSNFVNVIKNCLEKNQLLPEEIELEITESSVLPENSIADQTLSDLAKTGIILAIDDFGMGYTSLRYLNRFKVKVIKVDGSLTHDVLINGVKADIIRSIATLGNSQDLDVVAEYVESKEQQNVLAELGCNIFQGYWFSPPLLEHDCLLYFSKNIANLKTT
jgi:lactose/cellobiose-specific phosphotransferase system IIC component